MTASQHAAEIIESSLIGMKSIARSLMPLSDQSGCVPRRLQVVTQRMFTGWQTKQFRSCRIVLCAFVQVSFVAKAPRVTARQQTSARR